MFGDNRPLFERYVKTEKKAILPWPLNIVDCFFLFNAFRINAGDRDKFFLRRIYGDYSDEVSINSAYDLYNVDRESHGFEVALVDFNSQCYCYWDLYERFVVVGGESKFISVARPYPLDIEKHRYVEDMLRVDGGGEGQAPEAIYDELFSYHENEGPITESE